VWARDPKGALLSSEGARLDRERHVSILNEIWPQDNMDIFVRHFACLKYFAYHLR
jgi:hypothetical protein